MFVRQHICLLSLPQESLSARFFNSSFKPQLIAFEDKLLESWKLTLPPDLHKQSCWDQVACKATYSTLLKNCDQPRRIRLLAGSTPYSGAWLNALPSSSVGTHLEQDCLRIGLALRIGQPVCAEHVLSLRKQSRSFWSTPSFLQDECWPYSLSF